MTKKTLTCAERDAKAKKKQKKDLGDAQDSHKGLTIAQHFRNKDEKKPERIWRAHPDAPARDELSEFTALAAQSELQSGEMNYEDAGEIHSADKAKVLEHATVTAHVAYDACKAAGPNTTIHKVTVLLGPDKRIKEAREGNFRYNLKIDDDVLAGSQDRASVVNQAVALVSGLYDQQYGAGAEESVQIGVWLHFTCNYNPTGKVEHARVVYDRAGLDQAKTDFLF